MRLCVLDDAPPVAELLDGNRHVVGKPLGERFSKRILDQPGTEDLVARPPVGGQIRKWIRHKFEPPVHGDGERVASPQHGDAPKDDEKCGEEPNVGEANGGLKARLARKPAANKSCAHAAVQENDLDLGAGVKAEHSLLSVVAGGSNT